MDDTHRALRPGTIVFGLAMIGFGALCLARVDVVPDIEPLPSWAVGRPLWGVLSGLVLAGAGALLVAGRRAREAAAGVGTFLGAWLVFLHVPRLVAQPRNGGAWVVAFETLALASYAWMLVCALGPERPWRRVWTAARVCLGVAFLAFGASHVVYHGYVESVIPAWIPAPRFWTYATAAAHVAAGLSLLRGVATRLAATLLAVMFGTWAVILHTPRAIAAGARPNEWSSLLVAVAMCGGAWLLSSTLRDRRA